MGNKLREQLRLKMLGHLSGERTDEDVNNAYNLAVDFTLSFVYFLRENYHTEFETWTKDPLPKYTVQCKNSYKITSIGEVFKGFITNKN